MRDSFRYGRRCRLTERFGRGRDQCGRRVFFGPYPIAKRDEIAAGLRQRGNLGEVVRIADARYFENFRPPADALDHSREWRAAAVSVGLAEHDVIGAAFGGEHGIMATLEAMLAAEGGAD